MYDRFADANLYVYHVARGALLDVVIWCLGPLVNESREYGVFRSYLAAATCVICRRVLRLRD